jgi:ATP-dependent Lhr-like helicase
LEQLRGLALPGNLWERDVLPARIADYAGSDLEGLMEGGEWVWVGEGQDSKRTRVRFFHRGEGSLFLQDPDIKGLDEPARSIYDYLAGEGASFATDIQRVTRLDSDTLAHGLGELALRGLATNDALETLRNLIEHGIVIRSARSAGPASRRPLSALEQELSVRRGPRRPTVTQYREARRRTLEKIQRAAAQQGSPWRGRWSLVHRSSILGPALSAEAHAEKWARLLLARYGIVTRELIERAQLPNLEAIYAVWQRMEWRGQVRRGVFIAGVAGVQYALPDAVEQLRSITRRDGTASGAEGTASQLYILNAMDPANILGGEGSDLKFARVPSTYLVLEGGKLILLAQDHGERLTAPAAGSPESVRLALSAFFARPGAPRHTVVTEWNGAPVLGGPGELLLEELGFYRMPKGLERWERGSYSALP